MRPKTTNAKKPAEQVVKDIRRATRRHFSAEDKVGAGDVSLPAHPTQRLLCLAAGSS